MILRRSSRSRLAALGIAIFVGVAGCGGRGVGDARVVVPRGASLRIVADSLERAGVVGNAAMFRIYASLKGRDRSIRAGTYRFTRGTSWGVVLADLHGGKALERSITIPEGWSLRQIVPQLARVLGTPVDSVAVAVRDTALLHALDVPTPTLEGYLFPDTYVFPEGTTARQAVNVMVARFRKVWLPEWDQHLQSIAMSRNDVMSLAAIVEKEARRPEERPVIAAVYMNRLKIGMRLQADPTVQYALGQHVTRVLYKHLTTDSPYNTYRYAGLPPGPIASPGRLSIIAALYPAKVPYRFFVAYPDGHHEFTTNFTQHGVAVKRARRQWDSVATARRDTQRTTVPASVLPGMADSAASIRTAAARAVVVPRGSRARRTPSASKTQPRRKRGS